MRAALARHRAGGGPPHCDGASLGRPASLESGRSRRFRPCRPLPGQGRCRVKAKAVRPLPSLGRPGRLEPGAARSRKRPCRSLQRSRFDPTRHMRRPLSVAGEHTDCLCSGECSLYPAPSRALSQAPLAPLLSLPSSCCHPPPQASGPYPSPQPSLLQPSLGAVARSSAARVPRLSVAAVATRTRRP